MKYLREWFKTLRRANAELVRVPSVHLHPPHAAFTRVAGKFILDHYCGVCHDFLEFKAGTGSIINAGRRSRALARRDVRGRGN